MTFTVVQFSSVRYLDGLGRRKDMRDDSAEILFPVFFMREDIVSSSGMGKDISTPLSVLPVISNSASMRQLRSRF